MPEVRLQTVDGTGTGEQDAYPGVNRPKCILDGVCGQRHGSKPAAECFYLQLCAETGRTSDLVHGATLHMGQVGYRLVTSFEDIAARHTTREYCPTCDDGDDEGHFEATGEQGKSVKARIRILLVLSYSKLSYNAP